MAEPIVLSPEMITQAQPNVTFKVEGREDGQGYLSAVNTTSQYGLVIIQEAWGFNQSIASTVDQFAAFGFRAITPDLYRGKIAKDMESARTLLFGLDWSGAVADIRGAVLYLKEQLQLKKVGILGFCLGGALTVTSLANISELDAGSPYYGVPDLSKIDLSKIKVPVYAYFGENDNHKGFSSPEDAKRLEQAAKDAGVNFTLSLVPDAGHAFMNKNSKAFHEPSYTRII